MADRVGKTAIVFFNLGGPDCPEAVEPFLFNLFFDPAIIGAPLPIRWVIAKMISRRRAPIAKGIYQQIGGRSPLVPETEAQARALENRLGPGFKVFIAMRYWHPFCRDAIKDVMDWNADRIVLLPLYPQFSTTTTASSFKEWSALAKAVGLVIPTEFVCCYPTNEGMITAFAELVREGISFAAKDGQARVLFSAHGLPKTIVDRGDPYPLHVDQTARAVAAKLGLGNNDWVVCYQSRVGPLEWIGPSTEDELARAGQDQVPVVIVPIAFVSEHSETLVELDIEYRHRAATFGVPAYVRTPAIGCHPAFINGLAELACQPERSRGDACSSAGCACLCGEI